jgi:hypothetical protein
MSSALLQIAQAFTAALLATSPQPLAGGRVWLNRMRPISLADESAIVISIDTARASEQVLGALDFESEIRIVCFVRATITGGEPAAAVDALLMAAWARVQAVNRSDLGMLGPAQLDGLDYDFSDLDSALVSATLRLRLQHRTTTASLAPWA